MNLQEIEINWVTNALIAKLGIEKSIEILRYAHEMKQLVKEIEEMKRLPDEEQRA